VLYPTVMREVLLAGWCLRVFFPPLLSGPEYLRNWRRARSSWGRGAEAQARGRVAHFARTAGRRAAVSLCASLGGAALVQRGPCDPTLLAAAICRACADTGSVTLNAKDFPQNIKGRPAKLLGA